jgi:hypothetical protein
MSTGTRQFPGHLDVCLHREILGLGGQPHHQWQGRDQWRKGPDPTIGYRVASSKLTVCELENEAFRSMIYLWT